MKKIYKYTLELTDSQILEIPYNSKFLHFNMQLDKLTVWMEVDPTEAIELKVFGLRRTGQEIPEHLTYAGTCFNGAFVWHLYI
jgi:hypothetical protein